MATWFTGYQTRFVLTDLSSVVTTWLDRVTLGATLTYNLNQPATIDIQLRSNVPQVNRIFADDSEPLVAQSNRLLYAFFREAPIGDDPWVCRGAGIVMSPQDEADADVPTTHLVAYDPWQYLMGRPCFMNEIGTAIGPDGLHFFATPGSVIAATLLKNAILSESIEAFVDAGPTYGGTGSWTGTIETTPSIDFTVQQGMSVGDAWNQLLDAGTGPGVGSGFTVDDGVDIVLTPIYDPLNRPGYTHELSIYNLAGVNRPGSPMVWGKVSRTSTTANRQHDGTPGSFINVADFHIGQGGEPVPLTGPPPSNAASVTKYRPYWSSRFFPNQLDGAAIAAMERAALELAKQGKRTFTVSPDPLRAIPPFVGYTIGDRIPIQAPNALRVVSGGFQRVQTIPVVVSPDGVTRVNGLFTSPDWRGSS